MSKGYRGARSCSTCKKRNVRHAQYRVLFSGAQRSCVKDTRASPGTGWGELRSCWSGPVCRRAPLMANVFIDKYLLGGVDAIGSPGAGAWQETFEPTCDWMPSTSLTNTSLSPSIASHLGWQDASPLQLVHPFLLRKLGPHNLPTSLHL